MLDLGIVAVEVVRFALDRGIPWYKIEPDPINLGTVRNIVVPAWKVTFGFNVRPIGDSDDAREFVCDIYFHCFDEETLKSRLLTVEADAETIVKSVGCVIMR